ncbi:hypothetical protein ACGTJS_02775 [Faucicola mancuniensis]|uniref:hypothetical protein n=1 Tax=Faucicola mancuniensis TaxID=1309795 RepID=UPI0028E465E2|nr:hypothetical protein [uncultured Moraxella sp.]
MALNRFQPLLIAGLLPLLVFAWFAKEVAGQMDFWLLWLVAMTLVGLPMVFAEVALAHRSGTTPLVGLPNLTRESDVSTVWRGFGWLTVALLLTVVGHLLASSAQNLQPLVGTMATPALLAIMVLIVIGLSFTKHLAGWLAFGLAIVALGLNVSQSGFAIWQMTNTSLREWSLAVVLALVCVGAGTGLFWHSRANQILLSDTEKSGKDNKAVASRYVLPIWCFQMVGGALVAMTLSPASNLSAIAYALAMLAGSAYLLHIVSEQLSLKLAKTRFSFLALVITAVVGLGFALIPTAFLNQLLILLSLITAVWLAIFAGWQMKISHLRKSLNFGSEAVYNIWRIGVRIVVPLAILLAIVGLFV